MFRFSGADQTLNATAAGLYQRGLAAFETGNYVDAVHLLGAIDPANTLIGTMARFYLGQSHLQLGIAELRAGRHPAAIKHLNQARAINPHSANLSRYLAACFVGQGRFDLAASEIEAEKNVDANQPLRLAHAFARDGKMTRAVETLVNYIDEQPRRVDARVQLGLLYAASEQFEDAICVLQEAAGLAPLDPMVQQNLGLAHAALGEHSQAVEHLSVAQKLCPHDAYVALLLTMAIDAARSSCIKLRLVPETGRLTTVDERSLEVLGELIADEPDFVEAFLSLPTSKVDNEIFAMLAAIFERALENHPDYADLHHHCSRIYKRLGQNDSAIEEAKRAVDINPRYVQALIQLGRLYAETDASTDAIDRLEQAIEYGGDYPDVHFTLGMLYRNRGDVDHACRSFRRALELNSNYAPAQEALAAVGNG